MKVGDYVRTKDGVIAKITDIIEDFSIDCDRDVFHAFCNWRPDVMEIPWYYKEQYIIKSSPNIIDLIEVGDYVNGFKIDNITEKDKDHPERIAWHLTYYGDDDIPFRNDEIKSIVIKEQFSSMEYKVESEVK